ncbi:hypothetical protein BN7_5707 [Wickerhamomyces ciferrii]|uniref:Uncharacterized protein n=1 Tax=Wickerhamomyces ciferrii (strain ATCC 14091 / BCRC 22168 / CBS 111 / JCM 3599 / NBRC 0793 / NRRL Y-1031 F-60-10) TaxID=1206466 RepID=K0KXB0_WICCF|nr:uncharacterized protein BN7_5707 [Wickerhamomyces ciferrii]CCH46119.1 hypothetical protein BN7_5707 [Wickerhamomyces ciferrii]
MSFDHYDTILSSNLFLQTPLVEQVVVPDDQVQDDASDNNQYQTIIKTIKNFNSEEHHDSVNEYRLLISTANQARDLIIQQDTIKTKDQLQLIFKLWNIRLTLLVISGELQLSQQESKRLSIAINKAVRLKEPNLNKNLVPSNVSIFGDDIPLSLKILIIRLKSIGPNITLSTEYYLILWELRQRFLDQVNEQDEIQLKLEILSYSIASNLIAKREYSTFLTQADSIINTIQQQDSSILQTQFNDKISILAVLISFIKGDWDLANYYFEKISTMESFTNKIKSLEYILQTVDPVLDPKRTKTNPEIKESINLNNIKTIDDLFELIKDQRITGRILCSLCAYFELQLRSSLSSSSTNDLFESSLNDNDELTAELLKIWLKNPNKLYGFE